MVFTLISMRILKMLLSHSIKPIKFGLMIVCVYFGEGYVRIETVSQDCPLVCFISQFHLRNMFQSQCENCILSALSFAVSFLKTGISHCVCLGWSVCVFFFFFQFGDFQGHSIHSSISGAIHFNVVFLFFFLFLASERS